MSSVPGFWVPFGFVMVMMMMMMMMMKGDRWGEGEMGRDIWSRVMNK